MLKYEERWDLTTIPDEAFRSEWGRRNAGRRKRKSGGPAASCACGECPKCRMRLYQAARRKNIRKTQR